MRSRRVPATPLGADLPASAPPSLEEGYEWSVPPRAPPPPPPPSRARASPCPQPRTVLRALYAVGAILAIGFLLCWPLVDATREAVRRDGGGAVCLSPRHVWGIPAPIVAFEDVGVAWPRIVSGSGKVVARETSTLCPGAAARHVTRYERVTVRHVTPPWPFVRQAIFDGQRAVCIQHMHDLLILGVSPCRDSGGNSAKI